MGEFTNIPRTPFIEKFIEKLYPRMAALVIKDEVDATQFLVNTLKEILVDNAHIKETTNKLVNPNCEIEKYTPLDKDLPKWQIDILTGMVLNFISENSNEIPKGMKSVVEGFVKFWEKSEWTDDAPKNKGICKLDKHPGCDKEIPSVTITNIEESKTKLYEGLSKLTQMLKGGSNNDDPEYLLKESLAFFGRELEKNFNGFKGEFVGFNCENPPKKVTVGWEGIQFGPIEIKIDPSADELTILLVLFAILCFLLALFTDNIIFGLIGFILVILSSNTNYISLSFVGLVLSVLTNNLEKIKMEAISFNLSGGITSDGTITITGKLLPGVNPSPGGGPGTPPGGGGGTPPGGGGTPPGGGPGTPPGGGGTPPGGGPGTPPGGGGTPPGGGPGTPPGGTPPGGGTPPPGGETLTVDQWVVRLGLDPAKVNKLGSIVNYEGDITLPKNNLTEIPIKFGRVKGAFVCRGMNLTSLKNAPTYAESFDCSNNNLTTLQGGPTEVKYSYNCSNNNLTNLIGGPVRGQVNGARNTMSSYNCSNNDLISLEGYPAIVTDIANFDCSTNATLGNLNFAKGRIGTMNARACNLTDAFLDTAQFTCTTFNGLNQINAIQLNAEYIKETLGATTVLV